MPEFQNVRHVKASRKERQCDDCGHPIHVGEPYQYWASKHEGEFYAGAGHEECVAWANAVMNCDEGRGSLRGSDPADEYIEDLAPAIRANPPSELMRSRLPPAWLSAVDTILRNGAALPEPLKSFVERKKVWKFERKHYPQSWRLLPQWRSWAGGGWSIAWLAWEWGWM